MELRLFVHQYATRGVNSNLLVQHEMGQRELDRFPHLLLLNVHATNVRVADVWLVLVAKHGNGAVCLWRQNVY